MRSPVESHPEIVHALGVITARWSVAESMACLLLGSVLDDDEVAKTLYYSLGSFRQRQTLVLTALQHHVQEGYFRRTGERCLKKLGKLWLTRNDYAHSPFITTPIDLRLRKIKPTAKDSGDFKVSLSDLKTHAAAVSYASTKLFVLLNRDTLKMIRHARKPSF